MTRETKIGLLVGLAFIIVIGILLSDHLQSSTEPPQAPALRNAAEVVRGTVTPPGAGNASVVVPAPAPVVVPNHTVPTVRETQPPTAANEIVKIGPGAAPANSAAQNNNLAMTSTPMQPQVNAQPLETSAPIHTSQPNTNAVVAPAGDVNSAIAAIAQANGQPIVSASSAGSQNNAAAGGAKEYIAEAGDSLSKIAAKFYGTSTKAGRDAIVAANPSLANDPNKVIYVGKPYRIPAMPAATATAAPAAQQPAIVAVQQNPTPVATAAQKPTPKSPENWYTVKPGDNLTKIAREELGDASAVDAIVELNRDTIKDPHALKANMKIRLPGKTVAQAN